MLFANAISVINDLSAAQKRGLLKRQLKAYLRPDLLALDEIGYLPIDQHGADLLFQVIKNVKIAGKNRTTPAEGGLNLIHTKGVMIQGRPFADIVSVEPDAKPEAARQGAERSASSPTVSRAGPNLLVNPSFEEGLRGWTCANSAHCELVSGDKSASQGTNAVRITKPVGGQSRIEQDVTEVLRKTGPGDFVWGARVRGSVAGIMVKATVVLEADGQTQQHPAPDAATLVEEWTKTERRTPLKWTELQRATLRIESTWGENGVFYVDECWFSR